MASAREAFPQWNLLSLVPNHWAWESKVDINDADSLYDLVRLIQDEVGAGYGAPPGARQSAPPLADTVCAEITRYLEPELAERRIEAEVAHSLLTTAACTRLAGLALMEGDLCLTRKWLVRPLKHGVSASDGPWDSLALNRVALFFDESHPYPDLLITEVAARWAEILYAHERFAGSLRIVAMNLFGPLQRWLVPRLASSPELVHVALAAAEWSCRQSVDDDDLQDALVRLNSVGTVPDELAAALALHLAETAERRGESPLVGAIAVLNSFRGRLTGTQLLRGLSLRALHDPPWAVREITRLAHALYEVCKADWQSTTPDPQLMADRRGTHFSLVGNIVEALLVAKRADLVGEVVGAWLGVPSEERRRDLIYWLVSNSPGVGWAARQSVRFSSAPPNPLDFIDAVSRFLRFVPNVRDADDEYEPEPRIGVPGQPDDRFADELENVGRQCLSELSLHDLLAEVSLPPRALVALPYAAFPAQPVLIKTSGRCWPWSVSLRTPKPDRDVKAARLVLTGTDLGAREIEGVGRVLEAAGVAVDVVNDRNLGRNEFMTLYRDEDVDLFWVVGHAEFDWGEPRASHLLMPDGSHVGASQLAIESAAPGRRLLVLNVCEGAMAMLAGGLPEFGIGVAAACPSQAVVGHMWPVLGWPDGALFGRLLADGLGRGLAFFESYENAVRTVVAGQWSVLQALDGSAGDLDEELRRAIQDRHGERLEELATWGSAAFME